MDFGEDEGFSMNMFEWFDRSSSTIDLTISDSYTGYGYGIEGSVNPHSYLTGSFERIVTTTFSPGTFVGDVARLCTIYNTGSILFHFRLDNVIPVADNEELTIEWKMSWGRY
jgi:hypothetical protein